MVASQGMLLRHWQEYKRDERTQSPQASAWGWHIITAIPFHGPKPPVGGPESHKAKGVGLALGREVRTKGVTYRSTFVSAGLK